MVEHCISTFSKEQKEKAYRAYVTDALKMIAEMYCTAHSGSLELPRYIDYEKQPETNDKSSEEKAKEIKDRIFGKLAELG